MGILFVTTLPAPIVALSPIVTFSTMQTFGPIYTLSPILAALPVLEPIVMPCERLQLFPILAVEFMTTGPLCPIYKP